jgi:plasmid maintenance system antidote protein VapI
LALRLSMVLGRSSEIWPALQDKFDLWQLKKTANLSKVRKIRTVANA